MTAGVGLILPRTERPLDALRADLLAGKHPLLSVVQEGTRALGFFEVDGKLLIAILFVDHDGHVGGVGTYLRVRKIDALGDAVAKALAAMAVDDGGAA